MWIRDRFSQGAELIDDCEALLEGRYAEHLEQRLRPVPAWTWVNLLAHGTVDEIRTSYEHLGDNVVARRWRDARAYLAGEILGAIGQGGLTLEELQREVLVPFELRLAAQDRSHPPTPSDVVTKVVATIEAHRRLRRHR